MSNTIKIKQIDQTELAAFVNDLIDGTGAVYTANRALISDGTGDVTTSSVTSTEVGYLSGVTSAIQTQLNSKLASSLTSAYVFVGNGSNIATGVAVSGDITLSNTGVVAIATGVIVNADVNASAAIALSKLAATTVSRALVSDASGFVSASSVTATELGYVSGVSSAIQTQINNKQASDATLTALAALTIVANSLTIGTGADAFSQTTFAVNTFPARASTGDLVAKTISDFALSLLDDSAASDARTTLGLGTMSTAAAADYLPLAGGTMTGPITGASGVVELRSGVTAHTLRVYGTYGGAGADYVRASLSATSTTVTLGVETGGTGADNINLQLTPAGTGVVRIGTGLTMDSASPITIDSGGITVMNWGDWFGNTSTTQRVAIESNGVRIYDGSNNAVLQVRSNELRFGSACDVGLKRASAGVLLVTDGVTGSGNGTIQAQSFIFSSLPITNWGDWFGNTSTTQRVAISSTGVEIYSPDNTLGFKVVNSGVAQFGTHSAVGAETVTGFITIKDSGGTTRKLAVVS